MKKVLLSLAVMAFGVCAMAQSTITFTEAVAKGSVDGKSYKSSDNVLTLNLTDTNEGGKFEIDGNTAYFGESADNYVQFDYRLKTGGKSSSKSVVTLSTTTAGTLYVYARTGSNSATDRTLVLTQDGTELYNEVVQESNVVEGGILIEEITKPLYLPIKVAVKTGDISITFPVNGLNFYGFALVGTTTPVTNIEANGEVVSVEYYNVAGAQIEKPAKGVNIVKTTYSNGATVTSKIVK